MQLRMALKDNGAGILGTPRDRLSVEAPLSSCWSANSPKRLISAFDAE